MTDLLALSIGFFVLFVVSLSISYGIAWVIQKRRPKSIPLEGAVLKISSGGRFYRSRFLGVLKEGWAFLPPFENGTPVPLRVGDQLKVEAACKGGALRFTTVLTWRSNEPFMMIMHPPENASVSERRQSPRLRFAGEVLLGIDGVRSALLDIGEKGARLLTDASVKRGDRVNVKAPWQANVLAGHVLDVLPAQGQPYAREVRIIFEDLAHLGDVEKQFAPAG